MTITVNSSLDMDEFPTDWHIKVLSSIARTTSGGTPNRDRREYFGGIIPWVKSGELTDAHIEYTEETITELGLANSSAKLFPSGTLLIALYGATVGKTGILKIDAATNQAVCAIFPNNEIDREFLRFQLVSRRQEILGERYGGAQPNISQQVVRNLLVLLPPLPEQRRIAAVLNAIQEAIAAQEDVIAAARHFKRSLMQRLFTYGPGREPAPTKETEIGEIPAHWEVRELGTIYGIQQGKALSGRKQKTGDETYPFLRTSNVYWGRTELATLDSMPFSAVEREKLRLRTNDLLICEGGDIGRTALWRDELADCFYQNHLFRVRAKTSNVEPAFHMYWMQAALTLLGLYGGAGNKTTIPNLSQSRLSSFLIPLPPLPEQRRIASILNTADAKIAAEEDRKTALDALFKSMLHQLMTGQVRLLTDEGLLLLKN